jgi:hypothetical protein
VCSSDLTLRLSTEDETNHYGEISYHRGTASEADKGLVFGYSGSEKMRILHNGNVGIGTTAPTFTAVSGSTNQIGLEIQNANNDSSAHLKLTGRNNTGTPGGPTSFEIIHRGDALKTSFIHGGTERMTIDSSGNVGIGTTAPSAKLNTNIAVSGSFLAYLNGTTASFDANKNIAVVHDSSALGTGTAAGLVLANNNNSDNAISPLIAFSNRSASGTYNHTYAAIYGQKRTGGADANWVQGDIIFATGVGTGPSESMRIRGGNVGIGTDNPNEPLHISGTGYQRLKIEQTDAGGGADIQLKSKNDSTQWILFNDSDSGNNSGVIKYVHSTNKMHFRTNDVDDRLVISNDGNVGIGTDSPGAKLDVRGSMNLRHTNGMLFFTDSTTAGSTNVNTGFIGMAHSAGHHVTSNDGGFGSNANSLLIGNYHSGGGDIILATTNAGPYASGRVIIKESGNVGIGDASPNSNFVVKGTASNGVVGLAKIQHTATHTYVPTAFIGVGRSLDLMSNSNSDDDTSGIRFSNPAGSRETFVGVEQTGGQGDVVVQGYDGVGYSEKARITHDGIYQQTGQRNLGSHKVGIYHTVAYGFSHNGYTTAGTPSNSNPHWLEIPLFAGYSESRGGGFCEIDICWHATHAQAGHLHTWKLVWGSDHGRILNIGVVSNSATASPGSYNPYAFTSSSALYRHPTAGDAYMTKLYIRIKGSTNHSGGRSILVRGMGGDVPGGTLGPIIDHAGDNTPDGISPTLLHSQTVAG